MTLTIEIKIPEGQEKSASVYKQQIDEEGNVVAKETLEYKNLMSGDTLTTYIYKGIQLVIKENE